MSLKKCSAIILKSKMEKSKRTHQFILRLNTVSREVFLDQYHKNFVCQIKFSRSSFTDKENMVKTIVVTKPEMINVENHDGDTPLISALRGNSNFFTNKTKSLNRCEKAFTYFFLFLKIKVVKNW